MQIRSSGPAQASASVRALSRLVWTLIGQVGLTFRTRSASCAGSAERGCPLLLTITLSAGGYPVAISGPRNDSNMPAMSLSDEAPKISANWRRGGRGNHSASAARSLRAEFSLCALSTTSAGRLLRSSKRPGQRAVANPVRSACSGMATPWSRNCSRIATAVVALSS